MELGKHTETLRKSSRLHRGALLPVRIVRNWTEGAPKPAGPRFSRPPIGTFGLHLASPPWPLYSIDSPP